MAKTDYENFFDEFSSQEKPVEKDITQEVNELNKPDEVTPPDEVKTEVDTPEVKNEGDVEPNAEVEGKKEETPEPKKELLSLEDIQKTLQETLRKENEERAKAEADRKKAEDEAKKKEDEKNFDFDSLLNDDEKKLIKQVEEDYPEVDKYFKLKERQLEEKYKRLVAGVIGEHDVKVNQMFEPILLTQQEIAMERERQKMYSAHPDVDTHIPGIQQWIEEQKLPQVKASLVSLFNEGTTDQIIELVAMYKDQKGIVSQQAQQEQLALAEAEKQRQAALEKKKQALAGVSSKNTQIETQSGNKSYEDYFNEFSNVKK